MLHKGHPISRGGVTTDPAHIAKALTDHWRKVFGKVELSTDLMEQWLKDALPAIRAHATAILGNMGLHQSRHCFRNQAFREHNGGPRPHPV